MQKKIIIIAASVVVLITAVICGIAIGSNSHAHSFGEWTIVRQATCEENGEKTRKCSGCDKTESATIAATGHNYGDFIAEVPATCLQEGTKGHYECSVCHKTFDGEHREIADLTIEKGHVLILVEGKEASCTEAGEKDAYRCSVCREFFDEEGNAVADRTVPALGHDYDDLVSEVPATPTENGVKEHKDCKKCGLHFDADGNELDTLVIPATVHSCGEWIEEILATCTENGTKGHYECSHCTLVFDFDYDVIDDLVIPAGHVLTFDARVEPTCETVGHIALYSCENCSVIFDESMNETDDYELSALGHDFGGWIEEVPATCLKDGVKAHKTCSRCEKDFDENDALINVRIAAGHTLERTEEVSATCTESGRLAYDHCSACNKNFDVFGKELDDLDELDVAAKNHAYGELIKGIEATCAEFGQKAHYHCANCNKDYDENGVELTALFVPALGHIYTTDEIIPLKGATCTEEGYIAHFECERCGENTDKDGAIIGNIVIKANGHNYGDYVSRKDATCTEAGTKGYYKCGSCGERFLQEKPTETLTEEDLIIAPVGHRYLHFDKEEAQCEIYGMKEHYECERCGKYFDSEKAEVELDALYIDKTGHKLGELVAEVPATETENGTIEHYRCENCRLYFDKNKNRIYDTIVIPKTTHVFGDWVKEIPATCYQTGTKGYYECSHCQGRFDVDYNEITDLTIPISHRVGKLTPASEGKCDEKDVLIAYYQCFGCGAYLDENMNRIDESDIFKTANRHNYEVTSVNVWNHVFECRDCANVYAEGHDEYYTVEYITENGVPLIKSTCSVCGYETKQTYQVVASVEVISDIYVGYSETKMPFKINYRDGSATYAHAGGVMTKEEAKSFGEFVSSLEGDFEPCTEKFVLTYMNFTGEIEITFRPFIVYGVVTSEKTYQKGSLYGIESVRFIYDCNYTRETGEIIQSYGEVLDNDGFDPDFEFGNGLTEKTFDLKYRDHGGKEYIVELTLTDAPKPAYIVYEENVLLGEPFGVRVFYSDGSSEYVEILDDMIVDGSFDSSVVGRQFFTVSVEGVVRTVAVNVRDPHETTGIRILNETIEIGANPRILVYRFRDNTDIVDVTTDMIEGVFNPDEVGSYEITVVYDGKIWSGTVNVIDPDDARVDKIESVFDGTVVWNVTDDGKIVENLDYLFINVFGKNNTARFVKVTEDMISYDEEEAAKAVEINGFFRLRISYYGKKTTVNIAPRKIDDSRITDLYFYDKTDPAGGSNPTMFCPDGDLSKYFIRCWVVGGFVYLPVTEDMFYVAEDGDESSGTLVPFEFGKASSGARYRVALKYREAYSTFFTLLIYSESDYIYEIRPSSGKIGAVVGTKEEVLARLAEEDFVMGMRVLGYTEGFESFRFRDLVLASLDGIDFGKPGSVYLTGSYKGVVGTFVVDVIPDVDGVAFENYRIDEYETITVYENGYVYLNYSWGEYVCVNEALNVYRALVYDWNKYVLFKIDGDGADYFRAEMLEDNPEVYSLSDAEIRTIVRIYTKNGFSLADIYIEDGYLESTVEVSFSLDGKYVYLGGVRHTIGKDNVLTIEPEGSVVYRYLEEPDGNSYSKGTLNDNGLFYLYMVRLDSDGNEVAEYLTEVFSWKEKNGTVTLYSGEIIVLRGFIVDGYLVLDVR